MTKHFGAPRRIYSYYVTGLFLLGLLVLGYIYAPLTTPTSHIAAQTTPTATQVVTTPTPAAASTPVAVTTPKSVVSYPNCTQMSFGDPSQIELSSHDAGLTVQADAPSLYQIYGNTADELRSQIKHCAPGATGSGGAEFTSQTAYNLTWQYSITVGDSCSLSAVKVGVHTAIALPVWQPTGNATAGLDGRWQSFITNLATHEQGHATIDKLYAAQLTSDLSNVQSVDCASLSATVHKVIDADTAALNQANDQYDTQTNHGATQGAILPTN